MSFKKHIILIGFMGSGKTTVAQELSKLTNRIFYDLDNEIEKHEKLSIKKIFKTKGEKYFRDLETKVFEKLLNKAPAIIATGGGIIESEANKSFLAKENVFYLKLTIKEILNRLTEEEIKKRPLAQNKEKFKNLFKKREPIYKQLGQIIKAVKEPQTVAEDIINVLFKKGLTVLKAGGQVSRASCFYKGLEDEIKKTVKNKKAVLLLDKTFRNEESYWQDTLKIPVIYTKNKGEKAKTLKEAEIIFIKLAQYGLARDDYLIVKGGGSISDLGAFAAGLYKRGLNLIIISTTILAAVDAAIGGKTAVNLMGAKNQVGHFYLAKKTLIDFKSFKTLSKKQIAEGLVEAYKTGLILDKELAEIFKNYLENILNGDLFFLNEIVQKSYKAKIKVVEQDFKEEKGIRDILNFGHTYGHVLEAYYSPNLSHGEAVAFGLAVAAEFSFQEKMISKELKNEIIKTCLNLVKNKIIFPSAEETINLLKYDKKIREDGLRFIALEDIEKPILLKNVKANKILKAAERIENVQ